MWHYAVDGAQFGPISASQLKALALSGRLHQGDLVWKEGMAGWVPASKLRSLFEPEPPPTLMARPVRPVAPPPAAAAEVVAPVVAVDRSGIKLDLNPLLDRLKQRAKDAALRTEAALNRLQQPSSPDTSTQPPTATTQGPAATDVAAVGKPGSHPASEFGAWYGRVFAFSSACPKPVSWPFHAIIWTVGIGFLWIPMFYMAGMGLACPACGLLWVRTTGEEELLARRQSYGQVRREDTHYSREGHRVGSTYRTEQVVVNNEVIRMHFGCKSCGHRWEELERRQSEA